MSATLGQASWSDDGIAARFAGVSIMLGTTQFTVTPVPRTSSAAIETRCSTPSLLAEYANPEPLATTPARLAVCTIRPAPVGRMTRSACLVITAALTRFSVSWPVSSATSASASGRYGANPPTVLIAAHGGGAEDHDRPAGVARLSHPELPSVRPVRAKRCDVACDRRTGWHGNPPRW